MTRAQVIHALRLALEGRSQAAWCREQGIAPSYLSDVLAGRRAPGPKVLGALGITVE